MTTLNKGLALFGGSFNPPTNAHLSIIGNLSVRFEQVVVMPAAISPFKPDAKKIPGNVRYGLLSSLCESFPNVTVSRYELDEKGVSYTYKTLEYLKRTEKDLFLVVGSDNIEQLSGWKNMSEIISLACFYVVPRPFFPVTAHSRVVLDRLGCRYIIADFTGSDGASTMVPVAAAFGRLREIVPDKVADYIEENGLCRDYEYINALYDRFCVKQIRRDHIYRTAEAAVALANIYGVNSDSAIKAALYHDCGKYVSVEQLERDGYVFDEEAHNASKPVEHCYTGEVIARDVAFESDPEILRAIRLHTTGGVNMTMLEKIIFCADCIEEGRTTPGVERIRLKAAENIDEAMLMILDDTIKYLTDKNAVIDRRTIACREWLAKNIIKGDLH